VQDWQFSTVSTDAFSIRMKETLARVVKVQHVGLKRGQVNSAKLMLTPTGDGKPVWQRRRLAAPVYAEQRGATLNASLHGRRTRRS